MSPEFAQHLRGLLDQIDSAGLRKHERIISSPQGPRIRLADGREVINLCANNYLGLASDPRVTQAAHAALDRWGYGLSSVRFICGTQEIHRELENRLSRFLGTEDTILYSSCFDANAGVFETLLDASDAVISDELNHASIIDGIRLSKAQRHRYRSRDMTDLEAQLRAAASARFRLIATDGVFSMDGSYAPLREICELADKHGAAVMIDDSHAVGFVGPGGRGTHEKLGVLGRIDLITGTLGKALGGASGGYASGRKEMIAVLRQRSRPYLFSNSLAPVVVAASLAVLELVEKADALRQRVWENAAYLRAGLNRAGLNVLPGDHPIASVMLGDAALAHRAADELLERGVYVIGFTYPVVPEGKARIRTQVSAAHSREDLDTALNAFADVLGHEKHQKPR